MQSLRRLRAPAAAALPRRFACEARPATKAPPTAEVLALSAELQEECAAVAARGGRLAWVFLGAPGVGKGTYASRVAALMGVPHVSAGDLVRAEIKAATPLAKQARRAALPAPLRGAQPPHARAATRRWRRSRPRGSCCRTSWCCDCCSGD